MAELRAEALKATPPKENGQFRPSDLVDVARLDPRIQLDIRYATRDNFLSAPVYSSARAFLQRLAAEALLRAHRELMRRGYGLLIFDAYRPEMSERSYPTYTGGTPEQRRLRDLLRTAMEQQGLTVFESEWWHFDYKAWKSYAIQNVAFERVRQPSVAGGLRPGSP